MPESASLTPSDMIIEGAIAYFDEYHDDNCGRER